MFQGCTALEKLTLGANLETIGNGAFFECTALKDIAWNDKLTRIDWSAFYSCKSLDDITLPESVEYIDDYVFQDCSGLLSVSLGSRVSHIGTECFSGLSGLQQFSVYAVEPPSLVSYVFNLTPVDKCKLLVPEESIDKYKEAEQWKDFMATTTSITSVSEGQMPLIRVSPGMLNIDSRPLKSPFWGDVVLTQYLANFLKHATKSFHGSFEVIDRSRQKNVHSISRHTLIKVAA